LGEENQMTTIRPATEKDQHAIMEIYNDAVLNTTATFDTDVRSFEKQMEWWSKHKKNHPVFVSEENGMVTGWASLSPWSDRCAYDTTVEVSVYIHKDFRAKGLGSKLLEVVTLEGGKVGNHTVISRITEGNGSSIHIHEKLGYTHVGVMKEVGFKFGKFLDVNMMQYVYGQEKK
jgi:L-amino acid N-acyltransferase